MFGEEPQFIKWNPEKLENFGKTSQFICQMCQILDFIHSTSEDVGSFVSKIKTLFLVAPI